MKKKKVWGSISLSIFGLFFWFFRESVSSFLKDAISWKFPYNVICLFTSLFCVGLFFFFKHLKKNRVNQQLTIISRQQTPNAQQNTSKQQNKPVTWLKRNRVVVLTVLAFSLVLAIIGTLVVAHQSSNIAQKQTEYQNIVGREQIDQKTAQSSIGVGIVLFILFLCFVATLIVSYKEKKNESWDKIIIQPAFVATVGVIIVNALMYLQFYVGWRWIWDKQTTYWGICMGAPIFAYFITKKETWAKWVAWIMVGIFASGIIITPKLDDKTTGKTSIVSKTYEGGIINSSHSVPVEIALPIIADCVSGGGVAGAAHQFELDEDGKIVVDSKGNKIPLKNREGSTAIGEYQLLASAHEERAKKMGFDIRTEEGNEAYAKVLYQESGTKHWEVDPRDKACWEPKLRAFMWGGEGFSIVVVAPTDTSGEIKPTSNTMTEKFMGHGKKYRVCWNCGLADQLEEDWPLLDGKETKRPENIYSFRFQSLEKEPIRIVVKYYQ